MLNYIRGVKLPFETVLRGEDGIITILMILISLIVIFTFGMGPVSADSSIIYVNDSGGNDSWDGQYDTWQIGTSFGPKKSIKNASETVTENGMINIADGTYTGDNNTNITINKNIILVGQSQNNTIINGANAPGIFIIQNGCEVGIFNLTLTNGNTGGGRPIYNDNSDLFVFNCKFTDNIVNGNGGAIYNDGGNLNIINSTFSGNEATWGSSCGAIYNAEGTLNILNSIFSENIARYSTGGAISIVGGNFTADNCTFTSNTASSGGVIFNFDNNGNLISNVFLNNCTFTNNTARFGGAIENQGTNIYVLDSNFTNNNKSGQTGVGRGGAIENTRGYLTAFNCIFTGNTSPDEGGAIYNTDILELVNCTFTANSAKEKGGVIYNWVCGNMSVLSCTFTNNTANLGGVIYNNGGTGFLNSFIGFNNTFTNNNAYLGGVIYNNVNGNLTVISSNFTGNTAFQGGAIYNNGDVAGIFFNRFTGNPDHSGLEIYSGSGFVNAEINWWGSNDTPLSKVYGSVNVSPWLVLNLTANPALIEIGNTTNITVDILHDQNGVYYDPANGHVPDGIPVNFTTTLGSINSPLSIVNGTAQTSLSSGAINGVADTSATVDSQILHTSVTINPIAPTITAIDPANNAVNVDFNYVITVTFSEAVKEGNLNLIQLKNSTGTIIPTAKKIKGNVLTITPTSALSEAKYMLLLYAGCVTDLAGNPLAAKTSNFIVGPPPTVTSTDPTNYAVNVASNKIITVTFNEPIKTGNNNIQLKTSTGTVIPITKTISGNTLTIIPTSPLAEARYVILIYSGSVTDLVGNPVAAKTSSFSVGPPPIVTSTDPTNYAVNVPTNKVITATFNEPILAKYLTLIQLKDTTTGLMVTTTKSVSGNTLTITPTTTLAANTRYLLLIYTFAVTDLSGNSNVNKAISFTTSVI